MTRARPAVPRIPAAYQGAIAELAASLHVPPAEARRRVVAAYAASNPALAETDRWAAALGAVAPSPAAAEPEGRARSVADALVRIALRGTLFHDQAGTAYARVAVDAHHETYRVGSGRYRSWLARSYWAETGEAAHGDAVSTALTVIQARALYDGPECPVYTRVAGLANEVWVDVGDAEWHAVRITPGGWTVEDESPVRFVRPPTSMPLTLPQPGGSLRDLLPFLNATDTEDEHYVLGVSWLIGCYHPDGPYPLLNITGEQGTGKSDQAVRLRSLVDPSSAPLRSVPREERDLAVAARNSAVLILDNVSSVPAWLSDSLCRLSTGGGFATRTLYSDDDETTFTEKRPVAITSIAPVVEHADLLDRVLLVELPLIERYEREEDLARRFEQQAPGILGAVFTAVASALAHRSAVEVPASLRMADFAAWVIAAEPALPWRPGTFARIYLENRESASAATVSGNPVGDAILALVGAAGEYEGTPSGLLRVLGQYATPPVDPGKPIPRGWPGRASDLAATLRRLVPGLRRLGISVELGIRTGHARTRSVRVRKAASAPSAPSAASAPPTIEAYAPADAADAADASPPHSGGDAQSPIEEPLGWDAHRVRPRRGGGA